MKNNKISKRHIILEASYKLLLHRSYKDVTFSDIENETHLTRGAIYYYFDNKKLLFEEVVRFFYFSHFNNYNHNWLTSDRITIDGFRNLYQCPFERIIIDIQRMSSRFNITNPAKSFCHFSIQASAIYPDFDNEVRILLDKEFAKVKKLLLISSDLTIETNKLDSMLKDIYERNYLEIFKSAFLS